MRLALFAVFLTLLALALCADDAKSASEKKLKRSGTAQERTELRHLLFSDGYDKKTIPDDVKLSFGMTLFNLDTDEKKMTLETDGWLRFSWVDSRLAWDNTKIPIDVMRIFTEDIWMPDITLYNSADLKDMMSCFQTSPIVYSDGKVLWIPPCHFSSHCNLTVEQMPFAEQECKMKFGSWVWDGYLLDLTIDSDKADASNYIGTKYEVTYNNATREEKFYDCCPEPYISVTYDFKLKRHQPSEHVCKKN